MQSVIEHLRTHAPAHASFYRLVGRTPRGEYELFPRDSYSVYALGEAPRGLLPGLYQVFYFDSAGRQIQTARVELNLTEATAAALGPIEVAGIARHATGADGAGQRALTGSSAQLSLPLPLPNATVLSPSAQTDLAQEQAAHRMKMESDAQKQSFIHNSLYARETGEALMLNRMLRQEMYELSKQSRTQSQDSYADIEKQLATMRMLREAQKEMLQYMKEAIPPPQPQKVDLIPLAQQGIQTIHDIGMALLQAQRAASPPQTAPVRQPSADALAPTASPALSRVLRQPIEMQSSPAPFSLDASTLPERPESD